MVNEWHAFLVQAGANINGGRVVDFGHAADERKAALDADIIVDLSHFALLKVAGADSLNYLQGQLTNDVRQVTAEHSQLSSHLSPKGRMLNAFRLFRRGESYYLRMPAELLADALIRLRKYVLMSKVTLTDASDELLRIGISGPHAVASLAQELGQMPHAVNEVIQAKGLTVIRVAGPHPRVEVYGEAEAVKALWQRLSASTRVAGAPAWALLDIHAGIPNVFASSVEAFVPQMVNMQILDGVSFRKGCYTGQEVVARMQYLGKLKRRMYLAHIDGNSQPLPGDELYCANSESGQGAGKVVDAQPAPGGGFDLLAVVQVSLVDSNDAVRLYDANGPQLQFRPLPYAFPVEEQNTGS